MQPRLIKLAIPKSTLAPCSVIHDWLLSLDKTALMPKERSTSDAMRCAITYVLRSWTNWKGEDGTVYRALAASPTQKKGLCLDINVQIRKPDGVQYSETICRLEAEEGKEPTQTGGVTFTFRHLYEDLRPQKLCELGQSHLFDSDLRAIAEDLLEGSIDRLWPGVWLCLTDAPALLDVQRLSTMVIEGSVTLSVLTLDHSQANRNMLAEELAKEYIGQMAQLIRRLGLARPNLEAIERDYMKLCARIKQSEEILGVQVPCLSEQVTFEEALASTPA